MPLVLKHLTYGFGSSNNLMAYPQSPEMNRLKSIVPGEEAKNQLDNILNSTQAPCKSMDVGDIPQMRSKFSSKEAPGHLSHLNSFFFPKQIENFPRKPQFQT
jgi:hypothetical protein